MGVSRQRDFKFRPVVISAYRAIKRISLSTEELYGLEAANVEIEKVPMQVGPTAKVKENGK